MPEYSERFFRSGALRIHFRDWGNPDAPPLVIVHGLRDHSHSFDDLARGLLDRFHVLAIDLRGHGESAVPPPTSPLTMPRLVADATELMDHLGLAAAHLVGNSAGGYIAQNLAIAHPARVKSLALFGSGTGLKGTDATNWVERIGAEGLRAFLARTIAYRFDPDVDRGCVEWFLDEVAKNDVALLARFVGLMTSLDWTDQLHRITCPTLLVIPGEDVATKVRNYDASLRLIPDIRSIVYEGKRHNVCDAMPDRCAADVLAFLRSLG